MSKPPIQIEMRNTEAKLLDKYFLWSKLFILLIILFIVILSIVVIGVYIFGYGHTWALFSLDAWIILLCLLCVIFIVLEFVFYYHFSSVRAKRVELERPKPEFIDGKKVFIFTFPKGAEGGVFSKTYVEIDNKNILRIRSLIVPPDELWGNKEI